MHFLGVNSKLLGLGATIGQQLPNLRLKLLKQRTYNWRGITKKKAVFPLIWRSDNLHPCAHIRRTGNILFRAPPVSPFLIQREAQLGHRIQEDGFRFVRKVFWRDEFGTFVKRISGLMDKPTLIVCWKDISSDDEGSVSQDMRNVLEGCRPVRILIRNCLLLPTITYYGAVNNKSTNSWIRGRLYFELNE